jgi:hypothetical protein
MNHQCDGLLHGQWFLHNCLCGHFFTLRGILAQLPPEQLRLVLAYAEGVQKAYQAPDYNKMVYETVIDPVVHQAAAELSARGAGWLHAKLTEAERETGRNEHLSNIERLRQNERGK